ncbi:MAG: ATP-binding protein [Deltaproteobacteria bacterium]|nr:MAG: ATP-binding protein [Deltaproteobacteria bacterium]
MLENWKSFRSAELQLSNLTLLIGTNASGKSNALEALKLLNWLAVGGHLGRYREDTDADRGTLRIRGGMEDLVHRESNSPQFAFGCTLRGTTGNEILQLRMSLGIADGELRLVSETLNQPTDEDSRFPLYSAERRPEQVGNILRVAYNNYRRGGRKPQIECVDHQPVFAQLQSPARFGKDHAQSRKRIPVACQAVQHTLGAMLFLDPDPNAMRVWADKHGKRLLPNGANVSAVLHNLCTDEEARSTLLDFIAHLPEQQIRGISFQDSPRNEVMVRLHESFGGREQTTDAPLLSDGTLRVLSIAAALLSVERGTLVVIEEIDNGVHPSRAQRLLDNINTLAKKRGLRVLLTTHNPALLDSLPTSAIPDVTVCHRDTDGGSVLVRLEELDRYPELLAQGPLGRSTARGTLERFIKETPNLDARSKALASLLDGLSGAEGGGVP